MPSSIPLPQLKFGKRKERSLVCEVFTDDGRWPNKELPVLNSCADDANVGMSFIIDPDNQFLAEDGNWHQLVSEKSEIPICLRKESTLQDGKDDEGELKQLGHDIFRVSFKKELAEALENAKQSEAWNKLTWIVSIVCGTVLIIFMMQYLGGCA